MEKRTATLERIEHDHPITRETDGPFLYRLQNGLLLALREGGRLTELQYRHARERLDKKHREWIAARGETGEGL